LEALYGQAGQFGVSLLGVSDHFCVCPDGAEPAGYLQADRIGAYLSALREVGQAGWVEVVAGLEFDWTEAGAEPIRPFADGLPLDFRIGSVHSVAGEGMDLDAIFWSGKSQEEIDAVYAGYWRLIRGMAQSGLFDIAGHLDLPKKFGYVSGPGLRGLEDEALDAIAASGMTVEFNTAGFHKPCAAGYPSTELLKRCRRREIPVTLAADAHRAAHLIRDFGRGAAVLAAAGYDAVARFRGRERWFETLSAAVNR
jgi:histidinol-phosphatase (PHP family)